MHGYYGAILAQRGRVPEAREKFRLARYLMRQTNNRNHLDSLRIMVGIASAALAQAAYEADDQPAYERHLAMLDRFPITLEQPYATRATEKKILTKAGCDDADFADHLTKWAEIIRKSFYEGAVDEIISTRRLVDIVKAFGIFNDKTKAIGFCLARFDDDTKEAFLSLYGKVDADADMGTEDVASGVTTSSDTECPF